MVLRAASGFSTRASSATTHLLEAEARQGAARLGSAGLLTHPDQVEDQYRSGLRAFPAEYARLRHRVDLTLENASASAHLSPIDLRIAEDTLDEIDVRLGQLHEQVYIELEGLSGCCQIWEDKITAWRTQVCDLRQQVQSYASASLEAATDSTPLTAAELNNGLDMGGARFSATRFECEDGRDSPPAAAGPGSRTFAAQSKAAAPYAPLQRAASSDEGTERIFLLDGNAVSQELQNALRRHSRYAALALLLIVLTTYVMVEMLRSNDYERSSEVLRSATEPQMPSTFPSSTSLAAAALAPVRDHALQNWTAQSTSTTMRYLAT
mmetsp:Transcript_74033/g.176231  ORF Transcript_74033/g.176231 Transcript_74033/m.176231 type:complete len:323 (-) Transcript_74033:144-1112(-)